MMELGLTTVAIIAAAKIILGVSFVVFFALLLKRNQPSWHLVNITLAVVAFSVWLLWPLQRMWWGNNGDEVFVGAFLTRVLHGEFFSDFYYAWLPPFYPPLYFWIIGGLSSWVAQTAVAAAKVGIILSLIGWFVGSYWWQRLYWHHVTAASDEDAVVRSPWFWLLAPVLTLLALDFDTILLKPYEALPALMCALFIGYWALAIGVPRWSRRGYLFFGVSAGILLLAYYFWWFIIIPVMVVLAVASANRKQSLIRLLGIGGLATIINIPYIGPLILSLWRYGSENWQASYFVPQDLNTFVPWAHADIRSLIFMVGIVSLICSFRQSAFIRGLTFTIVGAYAYQFMNAVLYAFGLTPIQAAKPFLFLGTALLGVIAAYGVVAVAERYRDRVSPLGWRAMAVGGVMLLMPLLPMVRFIDDPVVRDQIEKDLVASPARALSAHIKATVPDYRNIVWLSSGMPEINLYMPLSYYVAHNPHFSHPASHFTFRLNLVKKLTSAASADDFTKIIDRETEPRVTGLLLYIDRDTNTYPLFFWQDAFPNGGREIRLDLKPSLVSSSAWRQAWSDGEWFIYLRQ